MDGRVKPGHDAENGRNMSDIADAQNLADMIRAQGKLRGYTTAFEFEGRRTSFAGLDIHTNRVANGLKALSVKPHERVAYLGKNSDIYFELLLGAMKANVVMAPVNWRLAGPEIAFIVEDCKAAVLFVGPEFVEQVRGIQAQLPSVRVFMTTEGGAPGWLDFAAWRDAQSGDDPKVPIDAKDIAIQLYTSGTTGKPNPVTKTPSSSNMSLIWIAAAVSPTIMGTIGVSPGRGLKPDSMICSRK